MGNDIFKEAVSLPQKWRIHGGCIKILLLWSYFWDWCLWSEWGDT